MQYIKLNSGEEMPMIGTGTNTYGKEDNVYTAPLDGDFSALESAIEVGYRSIDAAVSYRNEAGVGKTIANSSVPREDFFITTKIPRQEEDTFSKEGIREIIDHSLEHFETDYIDLYLIHHPIENKKQLQQTWEVLEEYYKDNKIRSIGVSNFDQDLLFELQKYADIKPAVNQIQINLEEPNTTLVHALQQMDIVPVAWGPMKASTKQREKLSEIGKNYSKTWAQVLLKYQIQRGIVVIPKSHNPENQKANLDLFDFELKDTHMNEITELTN